MELIPLISAPIVAARIINVHLTAFDSLLLLCSVFSSQLDLLFLSVTLHLSAVFSLSNHKQMKNYGAAE